MTSARDQVAAFVADERGEDLIEYGLLVSFAAGLALAVIISDPFGIKGALVASFRRAKDAIDAV